MPTALGFGTQDGSNKFLRNVGTIWCDCTSPYSRKKWYTNSSIFCLEEGIRNFLRNVIIIYFITRGRISAGYCLIVRINLPTDGMVYVSHRSYIGLRSIYLDRSAENVNISRFVQHRNVQISGRNSTLFRSLRKADLRGDVSFPGQSSREEGVICNPHVPSSTPAAICLPVT
jgi:hypothetical protein